MAFSGSKESSFLISDDIKIFGRARNDGKKFLKLCQTSFSGIVHCGLREISHTGAPYDESRNL